MQKPPLNRTMKGRASSMRRNMTKEEFHLWYHFLRMYPVKFRRQRVKGAFICDFYCHRARLIVELDGAQHYSDYGKSYDAWRSEKLEKDGCKVLRFSNGDIHERFYGVCVLIDRAVKERIKEDRKSVV